MYKILKNLKLLQIIILSHISYSVLAAELDVYCATKEGDWKWSKDSDNKQIKVSGEWKSKKVKNFEFKFFLLSEDFGKIQELKENCKSMFGESFNIVQPSDKNSNGWYPFALNENKFVNGRFQCDYYYLRTGITFSANAVDSKFINRTFPYSDHKYEYLNWSQILSSIKDTFFPSN